MSTYYMSVSSPSTTSTDIGTADNPFLTFSKAMTAIQYQDTLVLEDGTYTIGVEFSTAGSYNTADYLGDGKNLLPTTTFSISGSSPNNVIIDGSSVNIGSDYGWWSKSSQITTTSTFFNVTTHNITFKNLTASSGSIFSTTGEDTYEFQNCIFDHVRVVGAHVMAGDVFVGPPFSNSWKSHIFYDKYNGRGIFKNCIFKKLTSNNSGNGHNRVRGIFGCMGMYLRFANCTIEVDHSNGVAGNAGPDGPGDHDTTGTSLFFSSNYYEGSPTGSYATIWIDKIFTNENTAEVDTITFAGFESVAGSSTFTISTTGSIHGKMEPFPNYTLVEEAFTIDDDDIDGGGNDGAAGAMATAMSSATHFTAAADGAVLTLTAKTAGTGWDTLSASTSNVNETMTHAIATPNWNSTEYYRLSAADVWPVNDVKLINCIIYNTYPTRRYLSRSYNGRTGSKFTNREGHTSWYNSEYINCCFSGMEDYDSNVDKVISKYTDCLGVGTKSSYTSVDPLFETSPTISYPVETSGANYSLRPGSPVIGLGIPVPDSFYDLDKPDALGTQL